MPKLRPDTVLPPLALRTLKGDLVAVPSGGPEFVHLQFRRFAGCPVCNTHLRTFARRAAEIEAAGVHEIVFFHSSASELEKHQAALPFTTVPDPDKTHYRAFGVETSLLAALHPKAMWAALQGVARGTFGLNMEHGPVGLPADVLVAPTGKVLAVKYGTHAADQWEVDDLLALVAKARAVA